MWVALLGRKGGPPRCILRSDWLAGLKARTPKACVLCSLKGGKHSVNPSFPMMLVLCKARTHNGRQATQYIMDKQSSHPSPQAGPVLCYPRPGVLSPWVVTPLGVEQSFHRGLQYDNSNIILQLWSSDKNNCMVVGHHDMRTVFGSGNIRKAENHYRDCGFPTMWLCPQRYDITS